MRTRYITVADLFSRTLTELMRDLDLTCTEDEARWLVRRCVEEAFDLIYADFMQWVEHGDDTAAKTRDLVRASLRVAPMYRRGSIWN